MTKTIPLLRGETTLESALASVDDMLLETSFTQKQEEFFAYLLAHQSDVEDLVSFHLGLIETDTCRMGAVKEWMCENFNVCIPIYVDGWLRCPEKKRVLVRFPLPYKLGESRYHGNVEEKLRCEAATFIWIRDHCPAIPIPQLWAFGFPSGQCLTTTSEIFPSHNQPISARYISRQYADTLKTGYLIMEYIDNPDWKMLAQSWTDEDRDKELRANFFSDLSRIMLSLVQSPLPWIGSLTIDNQGLVSLVNRPLTFRLQQLENKGVPTNIDRTTTYYTVDPYFSDLLSCHDSRIQTQANSIRNHSDGETQLSVLAAMRALIPHFTNPEHRHGPFVFTLTDMHPNNLFVDANWHIKCLIDLELSCVRPIEMMLLPPVWLTGRKVDELTKGEYLNAYSLILEEFFSLFAREEEKSFAPKSNGDFLPLTQILRKNWMSGKFWYFHALDNPKVVCNLYFQHIQPMLAQYSDEARMAAFKANMTPSWKMGALEIITAKLNDKEIYEDRLRKRFEDGFVTHESSPTVVNTVIP